MEKITTSTGVILDPNNDGAIHINKYIKEKGLKNTYCFLATHPNKYEEYLLIVDNKPEFASQQMESICVHIDILNLAESVNK